MSNLVKHLFVNEVDGDAKIIDCNDELKNIVNDYRAQLEKKRQFRAVDGSEYTGEEDEDGFTPGIAAQEFESVPQVDTSAIIEEANAAANEIIVSANDKAQSIIDNAKKQAEDIINEASQEGFQKGYDEGKHKADIETDKLQKQLKDMEKQLKDDYRRKEKEIEPVMVETLVKIFAEVTHVLSTDKKDIILFLVNSVMAKAEISKDFLIRVSKEDYSYIKDNKEKIIGVIDKGIHVEIVEDATMKKNDCIIETDYGIFDCSLDIQLENLIENIKILSVGVNTTNDYTN